MKAEVVRRLPNGLYLVRMENRHEAIAHPAGAAGAKSTGNFVRLLPGDVVDVELSPLDPARGRIQSCLKSAGNAKDAAE